MVTTLGTWQLATKRDHNQFQLDSMMLLVSTSDFETTRSIRLGSPRHIWTTKISQPLGRATLTRRNVLCKSLDTHGTSRPIGFGGWLILLWCSFSGLSPFGNRGLQCERNFYRYFWTRKRTNQSTCEYISVSNFKHTWTTTDPRVLMPASGNGPGMRQRNSRFPPSEELGGVIHGWP